MAAPRRPDQGQGWVAEADAPLLGSRKSFGARVEMLSRSCSAITARMWGLTSSSWPSAPAGSGVFVLVGRLVVISAWHSNPGAISRTAAGSFGSGAGPAARSGRARGRNWKAGTSGARHGAVVYQSHHHGGDGFVTSAVRVCSTAFSTRTTKGFGIGASICCKEVSSTDALTVRRQPHR